VSTSYAEARAGDKYTQFTPRDPCPVCDGRSWCARSDDGSVLLCRRKGGPGALERRDKKGAPYFVYFVGASPASDGDGEGPGPEHSGPVPPAAPVEVLDEVYRRLLDLLTLSEPHREALRRHGLSDEAIDRNGYRSLPRTAPKRQEVLARLSEEFERETLLSVPGLFLDDRNALAVAAMPGLLIPVRDTAGRVVALKVRPDDAVGGGAKYLWVSSKRRGGPSSGCRCHVALGAGGADTIRLTEGEIKADLTTERSGVLTLSAPGVANWRACLPALEALGPATVRVAFDSDALSNAMVAFAVHDCCEGLAELGYRVEVEHWDPAYKGIDDALAAGAPVVVLSGDDVREFLETLAPHDLPGGEHDPGRGFVGSVGTPHEDRPKFQGGSRPLTVELLPVPPLPPGMIPDALRGWLADVARRGCFPLEYPTASALVALSSLVGRNLAVRPKRHDAWTVVPNLWGAIVGPPGLQKTPAVEETLLPLRRLIAKAMEKHAEALRHAVQDVAVAEARAAAAKKKLAEAAKKGAPDSVLRDLAAEANQAAEMSAPPLRRYMVNDTTVEKLGELLRENPRGLLQFRDELTGFFRSMERQGHESDRGFYLEAWNGNGSYTFDRIGRGSVHIPALCLSVFGTIQPGPLARYLKGAAAGEDADGFMPRFQILLYPDPSARFVNVDEWPDAAEKDRAYDVFRWVDAMDPDALGAELDEERGLHFIRLDGEAQELFDGWRGELEERLRGGCEGPLLTCHLAKYRSLMPSLSLLFHVIDRAGTGLLGPITSDAAGRAAGWCDLLEAHARRVYQSAAEGDPESAARLAERIKQSLPNPFTYRNVVRKGWAGLDSVDEVRRAVGILEDRNWVQVVAKPATARGGRPSEEVWINPAVQKERDL
jgi:putative DNA primase/helicase